MKKRFRIQFSLMMPSFMLFKYFCVKLIQRRKKKFPNENSIVNCCTYQFRYSIISLTNSVIL